jgi:hypothetical protein
LNESYGAVGIINLVRFGAFGARRVPFAHIDSYAWFDVVVDGSNDRTCHVILFISFSICDAKSSLDEVSSDDFRLQTMARALRGMVSDMTDLLLLTTT